MSTYFAFDTVSSASPIDIVPPGSPLASPVLPIKTLQTESLVQPITISPATLSESDIPTSASSPAILPISTPQLISPQVTSARLTSPQRRVDMPRKSLIFSDIPESLSESESPGLTSASSSPAILPISTPQLISPALITSPQKRVDMPRKSLTLVESPEQPSPRLTSRLTSSSLASSRLASPTLVASPRQSRQQLPRGSVDMPESPRQLSQRLTSPQVRSALLTSPQVTSERLTSLGFTSSLASPSFTSPRITAPRVTSPQVTSPLFTSSPQVTSPLFTSSSQVTSPLFTSSPRVTSPLLTSASQVTAPTSKQQLPMAKQFNIADATPPTLSKLLHSPSLFVRADAMAALERLIITSQGRCPSDIVNDMRMKVFALDADMMNKSLDISMFDVNFQNGIGCMVDAVVASDDVIPSARLREWLKTISGVGVSSNSITALVGAEENSHFMIKATLPQDDQDPLDHEAIIGMAAINNLRNLVPNFMHTYGVFFCGPPLERYSDDAGQEAVFCSTKEPKITHLIIERIQGSTLNVMCRNFRAQDFLNVYMQLLNALDVAYTEYEFTHYDLHPGNVLVENLINYISIPFYSAPEPESFLHTVTLARIIDFGASRAVIQGQNFGNYAMHALEPSINPDAAYPMHDAYKLLLSMYIISSKDAEITDLVSKIYAVFGDTNKDGSPMTLQDRIAYHYNYDGDYYQPIQDLTAMTHRDLIQDIINMFNVDFIDTSPGRHIAICGEKCKPWQDVQRLVLNRKAQPNTLMDYCAVKDAIQTAPLDEDEREYRLEWLRNIDIIPMTRAEAVKYEEMLEFNNLATENMRASNSIAKITSVRSLSSYIMSLEVLIIQRGYYREIQAWLAAVICAFNFQGKLEVVSDIVRYWPRRVQNLITMIEELKPIVEYNLNVQKVQELSLHVRVLSKIFLE